MCTVYVSSASSVSSFWLELRIVGIQLISVVVLVSLGSSARVSLLMALELFVVGVALVGMVVQVRLGSSASVLSTTRHAVQYVWEHTVTYCRLACNLEHQSCNMVTPSNPAGFTAAII